MTELWAGLLAALVLGTLLIAGVAAFGHHIAYWLAYLVAAVVVFGGFLIFDGEWIE